MLSLLRGKKIRNFNQHSDIIDFFEDSFITFKYKFIHLIEKHQIEDVLPDYEFIALQLIFERYFSDLIAEARRREQQAASATQVEQPRS